MSLKFMIYLMLIIKCILLWKSGRKGSTWLCKCRTIYPSYFICFPKQNLMIRSYYKLSKSSYSRLKKSDDLTYQDNEIHIINRKQVCLSEEVKHLLLKLVEPPKPLVVIKDLQQKLFEMLQEYYEDAVIRKYLKYTLKYSFR